jgi:hypothetical protein
MESQQEDKTSSLRRIREGLYVILLMLLLGGMGASIRGTVRELGFGMLVGFITAIITIAIGQKGR